MYCLFIVGDLRDDSNPDFVKEYNRALAVVCDDLFFARYRRTTGLSQSIAKSTGVNVEQAALHMLQAMFGGCRTEDEKMKMVDDLLDVKLLPGTNMEGVHFNKNRLNERWKFFLFLDTLFYVPLLFTWCKKHKKYSGVLFDKR